MGRNQVYARIWHSGKLRKKSSRHKWNGLTWHYQVISSSGLVVLYDNTGSYAKILRKALIEVEALRHMEIAGHHLKAYRGDIG